MRRTIRVLPVVVFGGVLGAVIQGVVSLAFAPFLGNRLADDATAFEFRSMTLVQGGIAIVLGYTAGALVTLGAYLLRQPDDPMPRKPPARVTTGGLLGAAVGGFFGFALTPVMMAVMGRNDNGVLLISPTAYTGFATLAGFFYGAAVAGAVVTFVPSIAPVERRVRVRAQHLYDGAVRTPQELAVLVNRIKEGGEDALAAGKEFHLT